jgi:hypothetical protein
VTQSFDFGFAARRRHFRKQILRLVDDCVDSIGMDTACGALEVRRQDLRDALNDREGRRFDIEWAAGIAMVAPEEMRAAVAGSFAESLGYGIAPLKPLTTEERLARLEYRVATELGAAGLRIVEENKR